MCLNKHLKKSIYIITLSIVVNSCSVNNKVINRINSKFKKEYPKIIDYSRTKYQEHLRKRVLNNFLKDFEFEKSKLYVIESFENRGGYQNITKYQTVITYFWQNGILKEVYYINDDNKLKQQKKEYWGAKHIITTLKYIQEKMELNQLDSIEKKHNNIKNYMNHAGEFFITELDQQLNILKVVKCVEFMIE